MLQVYFPEGSYKKLMADSNTKSASIVEKLIESRQEVVSEEYMFKLCTMLGGMTTGVLEDWDYPLRLEKEWPEGTKLMFIKKLAPKKAEPAASESGAAVILQVFFEDAETYTSFRCGEDTPSSEVCRMIAQRPMFSSMIGSEEHYGLFVKGQRVPLRDGEKPSIIHNAGVKMGTRVQFQVKRKTPVGMSSETPKRAAPTPENMVTVNDFKLLKVIGIGGYGKVYQVRKKDTKKIYAMKMITKASLTKTKLIQHTQAEQRVLTQIDHPFLIHLHWSFQTADKLYFVMDYVNGGELFFHLAQTGKFSEERTKFYIAELVCALGYLHDRDIIYRDLKPENVLLYADGHVCLTDFGLAKQGITEDNSTATICGTAEYLAPEILTGNGYGKAVDWWELGILMYEMQTGYPPFEAEEGETPNDVFLKILKAPIALPDAYFTELAKDLMLGFTQRDPAQRIGGGATDADEIKAHPWFSEYDWSALVRKEIAPPFVPNVKNDKEAKYVDKEVTQMSVKEAQSTAPAPTNIDQSVFAGFNYSAS